MDAKTDLTECTLEQALELGRKMLDYQQETALRKAEQQAANEQARFDREWAEPVAAVEERWSFLAGGINGPKLDPQGHFESQLPSALAVVVIDIPGFDQLEIHLVHSFAGNGAPGTWEPREPAIHLAQSYLEQSVYGGEYFVTRNKRNPTTWNSDRLPLALAVAETEWSRRAELMLEADRNNAARSAKVAAIESARAAAPSDAEHALFLVRELVALAGLGAKEAF